jgi:hypothetical protein
MVITMTPIIFDLAEIAEVDGLDRIRWWCDLNPTQPFKRPRERERERERERGGGGEGGAPGREDSSRLMELVLLISLLGPPLYSGEGVHLAPPPRHLGRWPRERR